MEILNFSPEQFKVFFLILIRVSVVLLMFPIFGSIMIPKLVKIGLSLMLTMIFFSVVQLDPHLFPENIIEFMILMISELIIGLALSLPVRLFFASIQLAGKMIGFQMGFAMINVIDPQSGAQVSILDQIGYWVALLVFLALNGHHDFISAIGESFQLVGIGKIVLEKGFFAFFLSAASDLFALSVKIGSPAFAALLIMSAAFGLSAKFAPQMNILIAAFPIKIVVGLFFFGICLQIIAMMTQAYLGTFHSTLTSILSWMGGG